MEITYTNEDEFLFKTISSLKEREDIIDFFEDLCTIREIKDMSKRLEAAMLLSKGYTYNEVSKKTKVSSATLSRISKCLSYGKGYKKIFSKNEE